MEYDKRKKKHDFFTNPASKQTCLLKLPLIFSNDKNTRKDLTKSQDLRLKSSKIVELKSKLRYPQEEENA